MSKRKVYDLGKIPAWLGEVAGNWAFAEGYPRYRWGVPVGAGLAALGYGTNQLQNMAAGDGLDQERNGWAQAASTVSNAALYGLGAAYAGPQVLGPVGAGTVGALIGGFANNNDIRRKEIQRDTAEVAIANDGNLTPWYRNAGMIAGIAGGATAGDGVSRITGIGGPTVIPGMIAGGLVGGYLFRPQKRDYAWGEMPETFQD